MHISNTTARYNSKSQMPSNFNIKQGLLSIFYHYYEREFLNVRRKYPYSCSLKFGDTKTRDFTWGNFLSYIPGLSLTIQMFWESAHGLQARPAVRLFLLPGSLEEFCRPICPPNYSKGYLRVVTAPHIKRKLFLKLSTPLLQSW